MACFCSSGDLGDLPRASGDGRQASGVLGKNHEEVQVNYLIVFELEGLPRMTNASGRKTHWAIKAKEAKDWKRKVLLVTGPYRPKEPLKKARLILTRFSSSSPDPDGLVSGFKHIVDGLVECGVLANDKFENIGMPDYRHVKCKRGEGKVKVEVYSH
jgi:hypothetical protein